MTLCHEPGCSSKASKSIATQGTYFRSMKNSLDLSFSNIIIPILSCLKCCETLQIDIFLDILQFSISFASVHLGFQLQNSHFSKIGRVFQYDPISLLPIYCICFNCDDCFLLSCRSSWLLITRQINLMSSSQGVLPCLTISSQIQSTYFI